MYISYLYTSLNTSILRILLIFAKSFQTMKHVGFYRNFPHILTLFLSLFTHRYTRKNRIWLITYEKKRIQPVSLPKKKSDHTCKKTLLVQNPFRPYCMVVFIAIFLNLTLSLSFASLALSVPMGTLKKSDLTYFPREKKWIPTVTLTRKNRIQPVKKTLWRLEKIAENKFTAFFPLPGPTGLIFAVVLLKSSYCRVIAIWYSLWIFFVFLGAGSKVTKQSPNKQIYSSKNCIF